MDWHQSLEEELKKDFQLLKQLEDKRRVEDNPRAVSKWNKEIEEIQNLIQIHQSQLKSLEFNTSYVSQDTSYIKKETPLSSKKAVEVFFSYAREDEKIRDRLEKHLSLLKRQGLIKTWHTHKIEAGKEWDREIDRRLNSSDLILLLISSNFIATESCWDVEVMRAMERHTANKARVIPIIIDSVEWKNTPFGHLKPLPKDGKPVKSWGKYDDAFCNITQGIRTVVEELRDVIY